MLPNRLKQSQSGFVHRAAETSREAASAARPKANRRQLAIKDHLLLTGVNGLTRYELADKMLLVVQSITWPVRGMLDENAIVEVGNNRPSSHGGKSKILRLPGHAVRLNNREAL